MCVWGGGACFLEASNMVGLNGNPEETIIHVRTQQDRQRAHTHNTKRVRVTTVAEEKQ